MMSNLYATIFWTEFQQKMKDDGIEVPEKLGVNATAYLRSLFIRDCDPRKAMLDEIRQLIKRLSPQHGWFVMLDKLLPALDEMEAKL